MLVRGLANWAADHTMNSWWQLLYESKQQENGSIGRRWHEHPAAALVWRSPVLAVNMERPCGPILVMPQTLDVLFACQSPPCIATPCRRTLLRLGYGCKRLKALVWVDIDVQQLGGVRRGRRLQRSPQPAALTALLPIMLR